MTKGNGSNGRTEKGSGGNKGDENQWQSKYYKLGDFQSQFKQRTAVSLLCKTAKVCLAQEILMREVSAILLNSENEDLSTVVATAKNLISKALTSFTEKMDEALDQFSSKIGDEDKDGNDYNFYTATGSTKSASSKPFLTSHPNDFLSYPNNASSSRSQFPENNDKPFKLDPNVRKFNGKGDVGICNASSVN